jgi:hypothetical protein
MPWKKKNEAASGCRKAVEWGEESLTTAELSAKEEDAVEMLSYEPLVRRHRFRFHAKKR